MRVRLFVSRFLDFEFRGGLANFALEFVACFLEFSEALPQPASEFRKFLGPEDEDDDETDNNPFRQSRHANRKREIHME